MPLIYTIVRRSAAFSVPLLLGRFVSVALLPVYTRNLSSGDYGVLELLDLSLLAFSMLFCVQLSAAMFYFQAKGDEFDRNEIFSTAFLGSAAIGIAAALIGIAGSPWIATFVFGTARYETALRLSFASLAFSLLAEVGLAQLRADQRIARWGWACALRLFLQAGLNVVLLCTFKLGYFSFLWSTIVSALLLGLLLAFLFYRSHPIRFRPALFGAMVRYALPLGLGGVAMIFIHYGDRFFLQRYVSLSEIGIYSLAYKIGMLTAMVHGPFSTYWSVEMFNVVKGPDGNRSYARVFTYLVLALSVSGALLAIYSRPLVRVLSGPAFHAASIYVPWLTLAYVLRSIGDHLRSAFLLEAKTVTNTLMTGVGFVLCLGGYAWFIPRWGVWGAVAATVLAFAAMCVCCFFVAQRVRHFRFEYSRLVRITVCCAAVSVPVALSPLPPGLLDWVVAGGATLLLPLILYLSGFLTQEEKQGAMVALTRLRQFARGAGKSAAAGKA